jgi:hypothetical protein
VHSGGQGAGYSFADRSVGSFVESPNAGQRWVWYAFGGTARLWSGSDKLSINQLGVDVVGTYAIRGRQALQGDDAWLRLNQSRQFPNGVHTPGQLSASSLNVGGTGGIGWGDPGAGNVWVSGRLYVEGQVQLGAADQAVIIGGNQDGPFIAFHDDLWFSDPQSGVIEMRNADNSGWGRLRGYFLAPSSRTYKRDVSPLDAAALAGLLADALSTQVVRFRWSGDQETERPHFGVIAEDAPPYIVDEECLSLSMPEYAAMLLGAVQVLAARLSALEARMAEHRA